MLKTCLGCCSLQKGTNFIGWWGLVWSITTAMTLFEYIGEIPEFLTREYQEFTKLILIGALTLDLIYGAAAALMIRGVQLRKPDYLFPYLTIATTEVLASSALIFSFIFIGSAAHPLKWFFFILTIMSASFCIELYIVLIIFSFYTQLIIKKYTVIVFPVESKIYDQPMTIYQV